MFHSNSDAGPFRTEHMLQTCTAISTTTLGERAPFDAASCLRLALATYPPNQSNLS